MHPHRRILYGVLFLGLLAGAAGAEEPAAIFGSVQVVKKDGTVKSDASNVVVFVEEAPSGAVPAEHPIIRQRGKRYLPEVLPVLVGTTVDFLNDDDIFHNVFSPSPVVSFDLGVYEKASKRSVLFDKPGAVNLYCNIHPDMVGYVVALKNPYFALTGPDGKFEIKGLPPGSYVLKAWQRFGPESEVRVTAGSGTPAEIRVQEEKTTIEHKNKWGKDYVQSEDDAY